MASSSARAGTSRTVSPPAAAQPVSDGDRRRAPGKAAVLRTPGPRPAEDARRTTGSPDARP
ncbi:hypothetical protein ACFPM0_15955 [Pseudonocardia sulfidoxydans]|uniref:hypothetical protein n=1 Tax=Pseudonocardia sulfidoxydans TaxID=54011 RepID=UPI003609BD1B